MDEQRSKMGEREREREEEVKEDGEEEKEVFTDGLLPSRQVVMKARGECSVSHQVRSIHSLVLLFFSRLSYSSLCLFFLFFFCSRPNKTGASSDLFFFNIQPNMT